MSFWKGLAGLTKLSIVSFFKFAKSHWWIFAFLIITIPIAVTSIQQGVQLSVEQNNIAYAFTYPLGELAKSILLTNSQLYEFTDLFFNNMSAYITHQPDGLINSFKYILEWSKVIYKFFSYIFLMISPFILIYRFNRYKGKDGVQSSKNKDFMDTLKIGFIFLLIANLVSLVIQAYQGTLVMNMPNSSTIVKGTYVLWKAFPFSGILNLIFKIAGFNLPFI